ncbi:MAG: hypothetical protein VXZ82_05915 [Planctomycetota bacterium]|nr:hypothetical protein [Planctomycetota bacterium]
MSGSAVFCKQSWLRISGLLLICAILFPAMTVAQDGFVLQDLAPSPSDQVLTSRPNQEKAATGPAAQSGDQERPAAQPAPPSTATPQANQQQQSPTPQMQARRSRAEVRSGPNVASLGNDRLNLLSRSSYYASPIALSLGASQGTSRTSYFRSAVHRNLLDTPEMFGDFRSPGYSLLFDNFSPGYSYDNNDSDPGVDTPTAVSFGGMRVSENNVALPQDRIWFSYHHMHNAFQLPANDVSLDRFVLGFEKTFLDGAASLEFRLPMAGSLDPSDTSTAYAGGSFGNLDVIFKRVLFANDRRVVAAGVRVETPTGSSWSAKSLTSGPASFTLDPSAVHITPYLGCLRQLDDIWFVNSFFQLDMATNGDRLITSLNNGPTQEFKVNPPPMLQIDIGGGVWLVTPSDSAVGWAAISELHLATALGEDDAFLVDPIGGSPNVFVDQIPIRNILNLTNGLHAQINSGFSVRMGISVPLLNDRIFDTEAMVQVNRRF